MIRIVSAHPVEDVSPAAGREGRVLEVILYVEEARSYEEDMADVVEPW